MLEDGATSYLYGPEGTPIEQITAAGQTRYYHHDQLGSSRALTDEDGEPIATYTYTPYGTLKASSGSATNPFGYAGQYTDATGLQYLRARYYDPATAQFLTRDPLHAETGAPYGYASGDSVDNSDPGGLFSLQDASDALAGFGDALTAGGTKAIRQAIGSDGTDYCSGAYEAGKIGGYVAGATVGAAAGARAIAAARAAAAAEEAADAGVAFRENVAHIFRNAPGHLAEDTEANRALLQSAVTPENAVGTRAGGAITVYRQLLPDGRQVWVQVRNGHEITNGGVNTIPR
jgi:RHS repeat-associated protein